MPELALLIPTRGRPANVRRVIGAWDFTNAWDVADMILVADADDPEIQGYRDLVMETENPDNGERPVRLIEMPVWMPMVHKLNAAAVALAEEGAYFALGFAGDDHVPQTINWATAYLAELHKLGTGMVYGDDGYQGRKLSTEWAVTSDAVLALGRMVPADVEHMFCDNSIMELFGAAGALTHLPGVRIEHLNPYAGRKAPMDEQYRRVNSREQMAKDRAAYESWSRREFAGQLLTLTKLTGRPGLTQRRTTIVRPTKTPFPKTFKQVKGVTPADIEITLADLAVQVPADQEIVELGVFHGRTALVMAWGASQGNGAHVTAIDPWELEGNVYGTTMGDLSGARSWARYWVRGLSYSNKVTLVHAFSHEAAERWAAGLAENTKGEDPGVFAGAITWAKPVGLLFVDGDHTEEGARRDIETWAPSLAPGAVIAVDDYVNENYPGVRAAVDALVAEGVLAPVEIYHDRLAVTRLAPNPATITAITSEGVSPLPEVADPDDMFVSIGEADTYQVGPATVTETEPELDSEVSTEAPPIRATVHEGELSSVAEGTPVTDLTIPQMKTLARRRNIVLGIRKDKRDLIVQALLDGQ